MKYTLKLADDGRVLSATYVGYLSDGTEVDRLPEGDLYEYRFVNGQYIHDPLPEPEQVPDQLDRIEAQLAYTAMMTDTLLEE